MGDTQQVTELKSPRARTCPDVPTTYPGPRKKETRERKRGRRRKRCQSCKQGRKKGENGGEGWQNLLL